MEKSESEFYFNSKRKKYHSYCKPCHKIHRDGQYAKNGPAILARSRARYASDPEHRKARRDESNRRRARLQQYIWDYFLTHPCLDCGEVDPVVLEFDHTGDDKLRDVSDIVSNKGTMEALKTEIAKCEVVCANCHRRRTYTRANGWRVNMELV